MESGKARLNPFLFPPDTNFRFLLLMASVLGSSLFAYYSLHNQLHGRELVIGWQKCLLEAEEAFPLDGLEIGTSEYTDQVFLNTQYNNNCNEPLERSQAAWILRGLGLLLLVAGVIYWYTPAWRIRRDKLTNFSAEDDPELFDYLLNLCREAGLSKAPIFQLRALHPSPSGLAFGHLGRYYIILNGGLITFFYQDKVRFRMIVLHELAHLRNRDIDKTYFSLSIVFSFICVTLVPLLLGNIASLIRNFAGNISFALWQLFGAAIYIPVIYITLASILRSREIHADARVLTLDKQNEVLRNELIALPSPKSTLFRGFFNLHPNPDWRLKVFDEPHLLFGLSLWDAFLAGFISTFALGELDNFLSILLNPQYENFSLLGASLFFIPFVMSVVGLGVWQKVFINQIRNERLHGFGRYGLSLGLGMLTGTYLSFSAFVNNSINFSNSSTLFAGIFEVFFGIIFLVSLFFFFRWVAVGAAVWLETVTNQRDLLKVTFFGLLVTGLVMSFWIGGYYLLRKFGYEAALIFVVALIPSAQRVSAFENLGLSLFTESVIAYLILTPILLTSPVLLSTILWVFPLLSRSRKSRTSVQGIFIGDSRALQLPAAIHPQLRPFSAFLAALSVAIGFITITVFVRIIFHFSVNEAILAAKQWSLSFNASLIVLAIIVQIVLAVIVSLSVKKLGWAHGLFAAFVAGCLISIGLTMLPELGDCISIIRLGQPSSCSNFLEMDLSLLVGPIVILGTFFSFLPAFIMSWLGSLFRTLFSPSSRS